MKNLSPVKLSPAFKDYLWGGEKLKTDYNKVSSLTPLAESWELSAHPDGESFVSGGEYDGLTMTELIKVLGTSALGKNAERFNYFPVLIKFIDAKGDLSIQVHPDDAYALQNEGEYGKTEMWYILDSDEGACLYYGFSRDVTEEEFKGSITNGTLTDLLQRVPVKKGDVFFIPAGTVHAIGAGIVICEIQQNSNTTYRVYDYNRRDKNGALRPLHIEKALAVASLKKAPEHTETPSGADVLLASCDYFTVRRLQVCGKISISVTEDAFSSLIVTDGNGLLRMNGEVLPFRKGDSIFIPAQNATCTMEGNGELILTTV